MIVGNSSSGVREAPLLGIPCINIGSRQNGRVQNKLIFESGYSFDEIVSTYNSISSLSFNKNDSVFKPTNVNENILKVIDEINIKDIPIQKIFMKNNYNACVFGAGNIGKHHINSLKSYGFNVYVVDPVDPEIDDVFYYQSSKNLNFEKIDIFIISTTSEHHYKILEDISVNTYKNKKYNC